MEGRQEVSVINGSFGKPAAVVAGRPPRWQKHGNVWRRDSHRLWTLTWRNFFDRVNHQRVKDKSVLHLIGQMLKAHVYRPTERV